MKTAPLVVAHQGGLRKITITLFYHIDEGEQNE
jgi:hypothetical protein